MCVTSKTKTIVSIINQSNDPPAISARGALMRGRVETIEWLAAAAVDGRACEPPGGLAAGADHGKEYLPSVRVSSSEQRVVISG